MSLNRFSDISKSTYIWIQMVLRNIMSLLPDTQNCGLRMRRECRERFSRHWIRRKPLVSHPAKHHGTCVTHVPWCLSGSLTRGGGGNVPGILGACATYNRTYLARGPFSGKEGFPATHQFSKTGWEITSKMDSVSPLPESKQHFDGLVQERRNSSA